MTTKMTTTTITNEFTGYSATIRTKGKPSIKTIQKHLRKAKASDCKSVTIIEIDGMRQGLDNIGCGLTLNPWH